MASLLASSSVLESMTAVWYPLAAMRNPEIGVLGDVIRIPRADLVQHVAAEMIRRAAQRDW